MATAASEATVLKDPYAVMEVVRAAIINGDFAPNQRMVEADLCEQFNASRSAVRGALQDLANQGLIERIQNRGARVRAIGLAEAIEITEVRMVVEGLCAAKAAENVTASDTKELATIRSSMINAVDNGDVFGYSNLNQQLHRRVRQMSGQRSAQDILERLRGQLVRHQYKLAMHPGRMTVSLPEHIAIIDAVSAGQLAEAEAAMRTHLTSVIHALREVEASRTR
ncbi:GntR family transcriptional regulator [Gordonia bronchialis]|uniref:GntR family transcriptional regulator n=1 Tax=Gordonia bronchialis TaxID=2054 RepID=UPI0022703B03|nr:GntR family transcriptional regulator [Gordonia bronchialis]